MNTPKKPLHKSLSENEREPSSDLRVCVIGAGASGLTTVKALKDAGFSPFCYEIGPSVGGLWVLENKNARGGAYRTLHINTSTTRMQFSDFPMRTDIGDFPRHSEIAAYFEAYADQFSLSENIHFNKEVVKCVPVNNSGHEAQSRGACGYEVTVQDSQTLKTQTKHFDAVIVANGHHWAPSFPEPSPEQDFAGAVLHAGKYIDPKTPENLVNQRVLVIGMGNSAMDIACELSRENIASSVTVSARRGAWVLPKYILGKPLDVGGVIPRWIPGKLRRRLVTWSFRMLFGPMSKYGLPTPDHLIGEAHPTVSSHFPQAVARGDISIRGAIDSYSGASVRFCEGPPEDFDVVICATGYKVQFPFLSVDHMSAPDNRLPLYLRAFHPDERRIFFVGLAQTIGAIMPVAEVQARAIASHLNGTYILPSSDEMRKAIADDENAMSARFVASKRHTMQVDPETFHKRLRACMARGKKRGKRGDGIRFPKKACPATKI